MKSTTIDNILLTIFVLVFVEHLIIFYSVIEHGSTQSWLAVLGLISSSFGMGSIAQKKYKSF